MLFHGEWHLCDDGLLRPVIRGEILRQNGAWTVTEFLLDTGADRTVFTADVLARLGPSAGSPTDVLAGVGGRVESVLLDTQIRLAREDGTKVVFRGQFAAFTSPDALDMSVLGRDITNLFAVIVDRPQDVVCLLGQHHFYTIQRR